MEHRTPREWYEYWKSRAEDPTVRAQLDAMDDGDIRKYFSDFLEFGTAGLRGIMTAGIGAMNLYTVRQAAWGVAMIAKPAGRPVVIACDSRNNSRYFAEKAAEVLASQGIVTLLWDGPRPTPLLSFTVRYLRCAAGINLTASHNPKEYNGFKVYGPDGGQLTSEHADACADAAHAMDVFDVPHADYTAALKANLIQTVDREVELRYIQEVLSQSVLDKSVSRDLGIVYTPLHGAGGSVVPSLLSKAGYRNLRFVAEQLQPDGGFPTVKLPNPEFPEAFRLGIALAEKTGADIVVATDPDSDRAGVAVRDRNHRLAPQFTAENSIGDFLVLTGNQVGALLMEYLLAARKKAGAIPANGFTVRSIVSTRLTDRIAQEYGVEMKLVPTGFKYIGESIELNPSQEFLFGFEESNGYLTGNYCRDKDGCNAILHLCDAAAFYAASGRTLADAMADIYDKYEAFTEVTDNRHEPADISITEAMENIRNRMRALRQDPPKTLCGQAVAFRDFKTDPDSPIGPQNLISLTLADDTLILLRSSGTEPKAKLYIHTHDQDLAASIAKANAVRAAAGEMWNALPVSGN